MTREEAFHVTQVILNHTTRPIEALRDLFRLLPDRDWLGMAYFITDDRTFLHNTENKS